MFAFALAEWGPLIYDPVPGIYYRMHGGQDTRHYTAQLRAKQMIWTTKWLIQNAGGDWKKTGESFATQASKCPAGELLILQKYAMESWCLPLLAQHSGSRSSVAKLYQSEKTHAWEKVLKQLTPTIFHFSKAAFVKKC